MQEYLTKKMHSPTVLLFYKKFYCPKIYKKHTKND